ncbi:MAG: SDR family oxidoreductase [Marinobacter sp.]|nr:SDR family oxidoreductase [Marinobacter sp.]
MSKHEAEQGLRELAAETGMEVVIIRPPLVYGPGCKGQLRQYDKTGGQRLCHCH